MAKVVKGLVFQSLLWGPAEVLSVEGSRATVKFLNTGNVREFGANAVSGGRVVDMEEKRRLRCEEEAFLQEQKLLLKKKKKVEAWVGRRFKSQHWGFAVVLSYNYENDSALIVFENTGNEHSVSSTALYTGLFSDVMEKARVKQEALIELKAKIDQRKFEPTVQGVGYLGDGPYNTKDHPNHHLIWTGMLRRCYSRGSGVNFYKDCFVDPKWHCFQSFCKDLETLPGYDKWSLFERSPAGRNLYQLDKDTRVEGNKTYGPEYCQFISIQDNMQAATAKHYSLKKGDDVVVIYNLRKWCKENNLDYVSIQNMVAGRSKQSQGYTLM